MGVGQLRRQCYRSDSSYNAPVIAFILVTLFFTPGSFTRTTPAHCYHTHSTGPLVPHAHHRSTGTTRTAPGPLVPHAQHRSTGTTRTAPVHWYRTHSTGPLLPHAQHRSTGTTRAAPVHSYHTHSTGPLAPHAQQRSTGTTRTTAVHWYHTHSSSPLVPHVQHHSRQPPNLTTPLSRIPVDIHSIQAPSLLPVLRLSALLFH